MQYILLLSILLAFLVDSSNVYKTSQSLWSENNYHHISIAFFEPFHHCNYPCHPYHPYSPYSPLITFITPIILTTVAFIKTLKNQQESRFNYTFFRGTKEQLMGGKVLEPGDMTITVTVIEAGKPEIQLKCPGKYIVVFGVDLI